MYYSNPTINLSTMDLEALVRQRLHEKGRESAVGVWDEIHREYLEGGPDQVRELLVEKVRAIASRVRREAKDVRAVAPIKSKGRRGVRKR
jgi:hypothetical protein